MPAKRIVAGIIAAVSWGTVFIFGQIGVREGDCHPIILSLVRFLSASFVLFAYSLKNLPEKKSWVC